jgi:hypothetical protein
MDTIRAIHDSIAKAVHTMISHSIAVVQTICPNYLIITFSIFLTGTIGGIINYLSLSQPSKDSTEVPSPFYKDKQFLLQILLGICGAGLIPLLLYLTSSKLFEKCDNCFFPYFVFAGYCFIGAIFSRAMLKSLAKRLDLEKFEDTLNKQSAKLQTVQGEIKEAKKFIENKLEEEEKELQPTTPIIVDTESTIIKEEMNLNVENNIDSEWESYLKEQSVIDMEAILLELQKSKYKDRSINGICKTTKLQPYNVTIIIKAFDKIGLVDEITWYGKKFYRLTDKGREARIKK